MPSLRIAHFRRQRGLTQAEQARAVRISGLHLSRIENGHVDLHEYMRNRIVRALDLGDDDINVLPIGFIRSFGVHRRWSVLGSTVGSFEVGFAGVTRLGIEPRTHGLKVRGSTTELPGREKCNKG